MLRWRRDRPPVASTGDIAATIASAVAWWSLLSSRERERDDALTAELVGRFRWEAAKGFGLTEPMRVAIAAQGALMLAELGDDGALDSVGTVIVHRSTVVRGGERSIGGALVTRGPVALAGEAHYHGPVLISWSAARHDLRRLGTGRNVVIHEFAHKLDLLDGTPPLDGEALGLPSAVCDCEMLASCAAAAAGNPSTAIRTPNQ